MRTAGLTLLLTACAGAPAPPDWQANAAAALDSFTQAYLSGNTRLAELDFARARNEIARTGRPDLMARAELVRCAAQTASLVLETCSAYDALAADAPLPEQNYAAFIAGQWTGIELLQLPAPYQSLVAQARHPEPKPAAAGSQLALIKDPLSRLVAAGALLRRHALAPEDIPIAVDAAAGQGWRRPLLAWLGLQRQQVPAGSAAAAAIQRRIDLILQATP